MTTFSSTELLAKLKPVLTALGKTQAKKCTLSLSVNTTGTTAIVAGEWGKLSFHTTDSSDVAFARSYVLSDVEGVLSLDKTRFDLDLDTETLNDFPLFTAEPTLIEAGEVVQTAEVDDIGPLANKPVLPEISKLRTCSGASHLTICSYARSTQLTGVCATSYLVTMASASAPTPTSSRTSC